LPPFTAFVSSKIASMAALTPDTTESHWLFEWVPDRFDQPRKSTQRGDAMKVAL
jgi:hypothetical protein